MQILHALSCQAGSGMLSLAFVLSSFVTFLAFFLGGKGVVREACTLRFPDLSTIYCGGSFVTVAVNSMSSSGVDG